MLKFADSVKVKIKKSKNLSKSGFLEPIPASDSDQFSEKPAGGDADRRLDQSYPDAGFNQLLEMLMEQLHFYQDQ